MYFVGSISTVRLRQTHTLSKPPPQFYHIPSLNYTSSSNASSHPNRTQDTLQSTLANSTSSQQSHSRKTHPSNPSPTNSAHSRQQRRPHIPTIQQNLQRRNIVDNHRPRHRARAARQVVVPHQQQQREQLRETRHQQRRADERFVRVVRYHGGEGPGEGRA